MGKYIDYAWHGYVSEEEEVQIIEPWETEHPYSDYTRKPIAGLTAERYGSVNMPLYPKSAGGILNSSTKKAIMWKKEENRKKNNIIVFGSDMISDEQNQYEYGMENRYLSFIGAIAEDGLESRSRRATLYRLYGAWLPLQSCSSTSRLPHISPPRSG